jgi:hypothetical protein
MVDVEDTHGSSLGLLQLLHEQYGAKHCHGAKDTSSHKSKSI